MLCKATSAVIPVDTAGCVAVIFVLHRIGNGLSNLGNVIDCAVDNDSGSFVLSVALIGPQRLKRLEFDPAKLFSSEGVDSYREKQYRFHALSYPASFLPA